MVLKCGIVGLPNVGKSMLFNTISNGNAASENFPFCTIEPNVGVVSVPDKRMELLAKWANSERIIPTSIEFVDIAGLIKGAHEGEGLGNKFLSHIQNVDVMIHVIRCFEDSRIIHIAGSVDPIFDKQIINHELRCKDIEILTKKLTKLEKLPKNKTQTHQQEYKLVKYFLHNVLEQGKNVRDIYIEEPDQGIVNSWQLLTAKPVIYFANVDESTILGAENMHLKALKEELIKEQEQIIVGCTALEAQLYALSKDERKKFLTEYNLPESSLDQLIQSAYTALSLITYFTVGPKEVRAWTIKNGTKAAQAAGVIHSDFQRGFIKAEVISFQDYKCFKSEAACRQAGKLRIEGKEYIVQDGDIMLFRFNV